MTYQRFGWLALRITIGWYFAYAGISKLLDASWSAAGYLTHAQTFSGFYNWLASPSLLPITNVVNEWALLLIGLSLIFGIFLKWTAPAGAALMLLYYFPVLNFPLVGEHAWVVDEHLIYASALLLIAAFHQKNPAWFARCCGQKTG